MRWPWQRARRRPQARSLGNPESITSRKNWLLAAERERRAGTDLAIRATEEIRVRRKSGDVESLTAAGFRITRQDVDTLRRLIQPWQARSFSYYDLLGEIKFASQFYSRALGQLRLYVAKKDESGEWIEVGAAKDDAGNELEPEPDDITAKALLERVQDPGGGMSGLLSQYGRLMFLVGEAYLLVSEDPDNPGMEQWEFLSTDECRVQGNIVMRFRAPSMLTEDNKLADPEDADWSEVTGDKVAAYRFWQRHPRYSMLPDATMQGVLDLCEELIILTRAVRSRARSRLAGSGLLILDESITTTPLEAGHDEDPAEDPFLADLVEAMTKPIVNEGSASAVVPLVARLKVPEGKSVKDLVAHIQIIDPMQLYPETGLRRECIERIGIGLDMPPEALVGLTDANHWTGWMIDEQTWKHHLQQKAEQLVDDMTAAYLRPALKDSQVEDWTVFAVRYDASAVINHPDRAKDFKDGHAALVIGDRALREAIGASEDDAPTPEELARGIGIKVHDGDLAWYGTPSVRQGGVEIAPGVITSPAGGTVGNAGPSTGAEAEPGPPTLPADAEQAPLSAAAAYKVVAAADLALLRARELAGNRIRSYTRRDQACADDIDGVKGHMVAATLGYDRVRELCKRSNRELVSGCDAFVVDALALWGINGDAAALIAAEVEQHAASTLYEPLSLLPPSFRNYVAALLDGK